MKNTLLLTSLLVALSWHSLPADDGPKDGAVKNGAADAAPVAAAEKNPGGAGHRIILTNGAAKVPVVVVRGSSYQMGWHLGRLMRDEIRQFVPTAVAGFRKELQVTD